MIKEPHQRVDRRNLPERPRTARPPPRRRLMMRSNTRRRRTSTRKRKRKKKKLKLMSLSRKLGFLASSKTEKLHGVKMRKRSRKRKRSLSSME